MHERATDRARRAAEKGDDVERVVPGSSRAFAELDHELAPARDVAGTFGQRLELESADEIEQRLVLGADAGQLDAFLLRARTETAHPACRARSGP